MRCEYYKLGTLVERKIGYGIVQPGSNQKQGTPIIKVKNIISGLKSITDLDCTTEQINSKYERTKLRGGELIISVVGTIGKTAIVPKSFAGCNLVRATAMIDIPDLQIAKWVKYYLDSPNGQKYIHQNLNTTVQPTLNIKSLSEMPIPFYSDAQMQRIIAVLESLDDKIKLNNKINENLEQQAQAVYRKWFETVDLDRLPVDWKLETLGDIAFISKKSLNPSKEPETMLEHYSIPAFDESRFPIFELSTSIKSNKFLVDDDCLLISKLNPTTKRVWRPYCLTDKAVCSTEFIVYKAKDRAMTDFLYAVIDSASFSDFMCSHVTGSTGSRQRTTPSETLSFEYVLPSEDELNRFQALVSPMYALMRDNTIENDKLKRLRDSLLPKLMSGEIDVEDVRS